LINDEIVKSYNEKPVFKGILPVEIGLIMENCGLEGVTDRHAQIFENSWKKNINCLAKHFK